MVQKAKKTIGLGILSWNAHKTLKKSLDSYPDTFLNSFDERVIYFSDISDTDKKIADDYGWDYAGDMNEGIAGGMKRLAENMTSDYILLLQNDNPLIEDSHFAINHIQKAVALMEDGQADLARMRHRWIMGEPSACVNKYLRYYPAKKVADEFIIDEHREHPDNFNDSFIKRLRRICRPIKAKRLTGRCIFIEDKPEDIYPKTISRNDEFLIIDSSVLHFSDQCLLISRDLWSNTLVPYVDANPSKKRRPNGFQAPEICINGPWWRNKNYKILQGKGLFGNHRIDGSYRPDHIGYYKKTS